MIVPKKKPFLYAARTLRKRVPLDVSDCENGGFSVGFDSSGGILRSGVGTEKLPAALPEGNVLQSIYAVADMYGLAASDGKFFTYTSVGIEDSGIVFTGKIASVQIGEEDTILLSDGTVCAELSALGCSVKDNQLAFRTAAYAYGRLWRVSRGNQLLYSTPAEIQSLEIGRGKGGRIELNDEKGAILQLVRLKNDLYIVREYGIQKLTARGDENDFSVTDIVSCAKIIEGSAAASEQTLYWLSTDGLHSFGEGKVHTCTDIYAEVPQKEVFCAAANDCYYLYANGKFENEINPVFAVVDGRTGGVYFWQNRISGMSMSQQKVLLVCDGAAYMLSGNYAFGNRMPHRVWQSTPMQPFGTRALLKEVEVRAKGPLILTVRSEEGTRTVFCTDSPAKHRVNLSGTQFVFRILAEESEVRSVAAVYLKGENRN